MTDTTENTIQQDPVPSITIEKELKHVASHTNTQVLDDTGFTFSQSVCCRQVPWLSGQVLAGPQVYSLGPRPSWPKQGQDPRVPGPQPGQVCRLMGPVAPELGLDFHRCTLTPRSTT